MASDIVVHVRLTLVKGLLYICTLHLSIYKQASYKYLDTNKITNAGIQSYKVS